MDVWPSAGPPQGQTGKVSKTSNGIKVLKYTHILKAIEALLAFEALTRELLKHHRGCATTSAFDDSGLRNATGDARWLHPRGLNIVVRKLSLGTKAHVSRQAPGAGNFAASRQMAQLRCFRTVGITTGHNFPVRDKEAWHLRRRLPGMRSGRRRAP